MHDAALNESLGTWAHTCYLDSKGRLTQFIFDGLSGSRSPIRSGSVTSIRFKGSLNILACAKPIILHSPPVSLILGNFRSMSLRADAAALGSFNFVFLTVSRAWPATSLYSRTRIFFMLSLVCLPEPWPRK